LQLNRRFSGRRRFVLLACVAAVVLVAAGCGGDDDSGGDGIKIALVTDTGGVDDRGFNEFSIKGMEEAADDLGLETRVYVSNAAEDYLPNLQSAAEDGNNLVIAVGFLLVPDTTTVAAEYPDVTFAGVDHFYEAPGANQHGMIFPTEEAGYLAGILASMMSESGTISTVGGKKIPPVDNWIAGFQQAAYDTKPDIKLLNAYSDDFDDQAKCKEIALDQISQGSDVVFQVAGKCGLGALDAACEEAKIGIGVDADQSGQGDCVITSALKPLEAAVASVVRQFDDGTLKAGVNATYGAADLPEAALLAPFQGDVPQDVQDALDTAQEQIKNGEIDPPATLDAVKKPS
jgi:basic membrane protein A